MLHSGLRICLDKDLVKDTIQDVLIGVWTSRHTVDRIGSLKGYLLVSLRNNLLRRLSRETRYCSMDDVGTGDFLCRSEEHTSELQSLMRNSYAVFCLKKKKTL